MPVHLRRRGFAVGAAALLVTAVTVTTAAAGPTAAEPSAPLACEHTGSGTSYDVGPDQAYAAIGDVPWESLQAGDTVRIFWRADAYHEKILLSGQGTDDQPIVVCGVAGPGGELPVVDGEDATTRSTMDYANVDGQARGLIHVSLRGSDDWGYKPQYLVIQGLHIRGAYNEFSFTASDGQTLTYTDNAAGIFVERGEHITVRGVEIEGNGNGFFVASGGEEETRSRDIVLERSRVHGNGTATDQQHNIYTESEGMLFQFNEFGPLRDGSGGGNLKDRSAGTVIRYNRIVGGARLIDLVDAEESAGLIAEVPAYRTTFVYGNVLVNNPGGSSNMIHYGGDSGETDTYRKGTLFFANNTVVVREDQEEQGGVGRWATALFDVSTPDETVDAQNNIVLVRPATPGATATELSWMREAGNLVLGPNWASPGVVEWRYPDPPPPGEIVGLDNVLTNEANDPGFADESTDDFTLLAGSPGVDAGGELDAAVVELGGVEFEYNGDASGRARAVSGPIDLGAYESAGGDSAPTDSEPPGTEPPGTEPSSSGPASSAAQSDATDGPDTTEATESSAPSTPSDLDLAGRGPDGADNGERFDCTGADAGTPSVLCVFAGAGSNGTGTVDAPFASIGDAIAAAAPGDVIQVAAGTYAENVAVGSFGSPAGTNLSLLGGFTPDFAARDAAANPSVIDGSGDAVPAVQVHVLSDGVTVLDGFVITNGTGLGTDWEDGEGKGGGVYAFQQGNGELVISHNEISGNTTSEYDDDARGGGISAFAADWDGSAPTVRIEDNVVRANDAGRGGGINVEGRAAVIVRNLVEDNRGHSDHGGGIYLSAASNEVSDNIVSGNEIGVDVGYGWGGGILIGGVPATLTGNVFTDNFAPSIGSGVFWDEGAVGTMTGDQIIANRCTEDARSGAALYVDGGAAPSIVTIEQVTVADHACAEVSPDGAAIVIEGASQLTVVDSTLTGNTPNDFLAIDTSTYTVE